MTGLMMDGKCGKRHIAELSHPPARRYAQPTRRSFLLMSMACTLSCVGCTEVGPNFKPPVATVAETYLGADGKRFTPTEPELRDWWQTFDDPTLDRLIDIAYTQNLTLQSAGTRILEARAALGIAVGNFYPQVQTLNGTLSYNRLSKEDLYSVAAPREDFWRATLGPELVWELDFWGKFRRGIESADAAYVASIATYDDVLVTLLADVATTYIGIRTIERQITIANANVRTQRHALNIAQTRFTEGSTTRLDVYQAQDVLASTQATLPQLEIELAQGKDALTVLLGMAPQPLDMLLGESGEIPTAPADIALGIPADLLRRRPDIRAAEFLAAAQSARIGFAEADLYPAFSLFGAVSLAATDAPPSNFADFFTYKAVTFSFGPTFQWNIFNYGRISNQVRVEDARLQSLLIDYKNTVLKAQQEVEDGLASFVLSRQRAAYLRNSVSASQGALRLAFDQYHEGLVDFTTVLTAEQALFQAQTELAATLGTIASSVARIYRALGGGWESYAGNGVVSPETRNEMIQRTNWGQLLPPGGKPKPAGQPSGILHDVGAAPPDW